MAGRYTCVPLLTGFDQLLAPQELCVVSAGRHGCPKRVRWRQGKSATEAEKPEGPGDQIRRVRLPTSSLPLWRWLAAWDAPGRPRICCDLSQPVLASLGLYVVAEMSRAPSGRWVSSLEPTRR